MATVEVLGTGEQVDLADCTPLELAGATVHRTPDGRLLAAAFRSTAVLLPGSDVPDPDDEDAVGDLVLTWVEAVRGHDWSPLRGARLDESGRDEDWIDLRTAMVRVGWSWSAAATAWAATRRRPYARDLPTAAGWAGAGWVVPAVPDEPDPAFARPVLEGRALLRWAYLARWREPAALPDGDLPTAFDPPGGWGDVLSRFRQDHYPEDALAEAEQLAVEVLHRAGLGPGSAEEAEDEPLADRDVEAATTHPSPVVRAAAWWLLRAEADEWLACSYAECQHHWAVEAEEDAYELDEVLELAGYGLPNPMDAARTRRRLLTLAFGDVRDVPLAGAGDVEAFVDFYTGWVEHGRPEEDFEDMARELRGDAEPGAEP